VAGASEPEGSCDKLVVAVVSIVSSSLGLLKKLKYTRTKRMMSPMITMIRPVF
jgi:hypothetical protein